jgi:hypothetical protein
MLDDMEFPADEAVPQRCLQSGRMPPVDLRQHRRFTGRLHRLVESCVHSFSHADPASTTSYFALLLSVVVVPPLNDVRDVGPISEYERRDEAK